MWHAIPRCFVSDTVVSTVIDELDRQILRVLQRDGRLSHRDIGAEVGLSPNATGARVARLLNDGVITGIHAHVDHTALGRGLEAVVDCWLESRDPHDWDRFVDHVMADDRVVDAVHLTGKVDYRLRVVVSSAAELDDLLNGLRVHGGIGETDSRLILRRYPVGIA